MPWRDPGRIVCGPRPPSHTFDWRVAYEPCVSTQIPDLAVPRTSSQPIDCLMPNPRPSDTYWVSRASGMGGRCHRPTSGPPGVWSWSPPWKGLNNLTRTRPAARKFTPASTSETGRKSLGGLETPPLCPSSLWDPGNNRETNYVQHARGEAVAHASSAAGANTSADEQPGDEKPSERRCSRRRGSKGKRMTCTCIRLHHPQMNHLQSLQGSSERPEYHLQDSACSTHKQAATAQGVAPRQTNLNTLSSTWKDRCCRHITSIAWNDKSTLKKLSVAGTPHRRCPITRSRRPNTSHKKNLRRTTPFHYHHLQQHTPICQKKLPFLPGTHNERNREAPFFLSSPFLVPP